jgi:hypothetical protein
MYRQSLDSTNLQQLFNANALKLHLHGKLIPDSSSFMTFSTISLVGHAYDHFSTAALV